MSTLITGSTGFVGINLVKYLAELGDHVICFDLTGPDDLTKRFVEPYLNQITFIQGDILDRDTLYPILSHYGIDRIVHAAVFTALLPAIEIRQSNTIVDINVTGTTNVLELARRLEVNRFLYVSSSSVYGEGLPIGDALFEESPVKPRNLYAITKYTSELLTNRFAKLHNFEAVVTRLSAPYGPMERVSSHRAVMSEIYNWTGSAARREPIRVAHTNLGRDYTYVADIVSGISTILNANSLKHDIYNVSSGLIYTGAQVISALRRARPEITIENSDPGEFTITRPESVRGPLDISRLRDEFAFDLNFDLHKGIEAYLQWRESFPFKDEIS